MKIKLYILLIFTLVFSLALSSCAVIEKVLGSSDDKPSVEDTMNNENKDDENKDDENTGGTLPPPAVDDNTVNLTELGYTFFSDGTSELGDSVDNFILRLETATGKKADKSSDKESANVIFAVKDFSSLGACQIIGRYEISHADGKLTVYASSLEAMNFAKDRLLSYATEDGLVIPKDMSEGYFFNTYDYREGKTTVYTDADLKNLTLLSELTVDGKKVVGFSPSNTFYAVKNNGTEYPTVSAKAINSDATVAIEQASADNFGSATVTVKVGNNSRKYTVSFFENVASVSSKIVVKGGAGGTICFVIDDGTESTAQFMVDNILGKEGYENIHANFGLITKKVATLETEIDENGDLVYKVDANGRYVYTETEGKFDFWRAVLATKKATLLSHTHTHTYPGDNDAGGIFRYKKFDGTYKNTAFLPLGNVTMELVASNQIVEDISGEESGVLVIPGVGASLPTYFNKMILGSGEYFVARHNTSSTSNLDSLIYYPETLNASNISAVKSYMIEHYNTSPDNVTDASSSNEECLNAGIDYWTTFMDMAVESGGWASFCIHEIRPDNYTGTDHHIYESQAKEFFAYANAYGDKAWIADYNEAAKYYIEWSKSNVSAIMRDNSVITVNLDSDVDDERLDMALTVRVDIPESWETVTLDSEELQIITDESGRYVYVDILPNEAVDLVCTKLAVKEDNTPAV